MIALYLLPLYVFLNYYLIKTIIKWLKATHDVFKNRIIKVIIIVIYTFLACSLLLGFVLPDNSFGRIIKVLANYWMGVLLYSVFLILILTFIRFILKKSKKVNQKKVFTQKNLVIVGVISMILVSSISTYGFIHSHYTKIKNYDVTIKKEVPNMSSLKIILMADLHLGYNTSMRQIEDVINKVNNSNADLVVFAGDIFDNDYDAISKPLDIARLFKSIKSKYGVYAVYGNHDINEKILAGFTFKSKKLKLSDIRMDKMLELSGIKLLRDQDVLINNSFYLSGRLDYERLGIEKEKRKTPNEITTNMDKSKPIIVIDHEPRQLQELAAAGVDLDLSGHTHDGQMFPLNIGTRLVWKNGYGMKKYNDMTSIVTSGVGVYGPNLRVGTNSEIVNINVSFK